MKFEIFAGPSLKISGGYFEISGELSFTRAIAQMLKQPFLELSLPVKIDPCLVKLVLKVK